MTGLNFDINVPTRVLFGPGVLSRMHELPMPGRHALVVISNGRSTRANGYLDRVLAELGQAAVEVDVFDEVGPNPLKETIEDGARIACDLGVDFVVALGGGSVMDAAKMIALLAPQPSDDLWDYATGSTGRGLAPQNPELPWIAITTTAGTGSEVDKVGVVTNLATHEKIGIFSPGLFARYAVVDPELMLTVPPHLTAYQGFDALFHNVEGYLSKQSNLLSGMVELEAVRQIAEWLPVAVADGANLEARTRLAFANTLGGYSMDFSTNISQHSMEHAMSAVHPDLPHGAGLIMLSRAYFSYWVGRHVCDEKFVRLARAMGRHHAKAPEEFVEALVDLQRACGVADLKMSDYGIAREEALDLARIARATMTRLFVQDPAETTDADIAGIYEAAWA